MTGPGAPEREVGTMKRLRAEARMSTPGPKATARGKELKL